MSIRPRPGGCAQAARGKAKAVAVTVDAGDDALDAIVAAMQPDMLQLHGSESPGAGGAVKARYGLPVMKALAVRDGRRSRARCGRYRGVADRLMFDAKPPAGSELPGGNGVCLRLAAAGRP